MERFAFNGYTSLAGIFGLQVGVVQNLFCKYDGATGEKQYFYLAHYKPCIRLNSVNAEISDNSARAFPVLCDFSYLIQLPMWMFDTYDEEKIVRIHLGVNSSDNISSIVHDNQFLSVNDEPVYINDIPYKQSYKYVVDLTSPNYHDDRIVIPAPKNDDYIVQVAKLEQKNSTIVNFAGFHKSLPKEIKKENLRYDLGLRNLRAEILEEGSYAIKENPTHGTKELIFFTEGNDKLIPTLESPIIITTLTPIPEKELKVRENASKAFKKIYKIRDQKCWHN